MMSLRSLFPAFSSRPGLFSGNGRHAGRPVARNMLLILLGGAMLLPAACARRQEGMHKVDLFTHSYREATMPEDGIIPDGMAVVVGRAFAPPADSWHFYKEQGQQAGALDLKWLKRNVRPPQGDVSLPVLLTNGYQAHLLPAGIWYVSWAGTRVINGRVIYKDETKGNGLDDFTLEPRYARVELQPGEVIYVGDIGLMFRGKWGSQARFMNYDRLQAAKEWMRDDWPGLAGKLQPRLLDFGVVAYEPKG